MSCRLACLLIASAFGWSAWAQNPPPQAEQAPPEEDEQLAVKEYTFNPIQAAKELQVGRFYLKKGNLRAAALRFEEATRWDPTNPDAFRLLGETRERQKDKRAAREAFAKYLELSPDAKDAAAIRKKLAEAKAPAKR